VKFKVGDKVRCIDDSVAPFVKKGQTYVLEWVSRQANYVCVEGSPFQFCSDRFEPVVDEPKIEEKPRVWCGICGTYKHEGDEITCEFAGSRYCGCEGAPVEYPPFADKQMELPLVAPETPAGPIKSDGGSTSYYELPSGATELNDLIEHKRMPFALGNIFKACYRLGEKDGADVLYDLNKIIYFANRLKGMVEKHGAIR